MSTTKTFNNIKSGKRHQIDATARGYYDFRTTVVPQLNKPLSYDMKVYDGLNYAVDLSKNSVRAGEINFDGTILPYVNAQKQSLLTTNYCFGNSGTNYDLPIYKNEYTNIKVEGNVNISDGIASGFSGGYITPGSVNFGTGTWEMLFKVNYKVHSNNKTQCLCAELKDYNYQVEIFVNNDNKLALYLSSDGSDNFFVSRSDSVTTLVDNTTYYIKLVFTGTNYILSLSTDGINYTEEINEASTALIYWSPATNLLIGKRGQSSSVYPWQGSIDLKESKIVIGEKTINLGDYPLQKQYTGYTIYGNAKVNDLICSGFDYYSKAVLSSARFNESEPICISFTTGPNVSTLQYIWSTKSGFAFIINEGYIKYINRNSNIWIQWQQIQPNTKYKIKIELLSNTSYSLGWSSDNGSTYESTTVTDAKLDLTETYVTIGNTYVSNDYTDPFYGTIDISEIPELTQLTESKPGIFINYEDNGKAKTLNAFSSNNEFVVLSPNENIADYTWLGTVNIPKHKVNWDKPSEPDEPSNEDIDYPLEAVALNDTVANYNIGDTIYVNEGMATSNYAYTAYAPEENNKNDFTIVGTITSKKEENGLTILSFDQTSGPTKQEVTITIDEDDANVEYSNGWVKTVNVIASEDDANISTSTQMTQSTNTYNTTNYVTYNLKVEPVINNKEITLVIGGQKVEYDSLPVTVKKGTYAYYRINKSGYKEVYKVFHINNYSGQSISLEANN